MLAGIMMLTSAVMGQGYQIDLKISSLAGQKVYLAHYYGRGTTVYKTDSTVLNKSGKGKLQKDSTILGGMYMILDTGKGNFVEFILNDGDKLKLSSEAADFRTDAIVTGTKDNEEFFAYQKYLKSFETEQKAIDAKLSKARTAADSAAVQDQIKTHLDKLNAYRTDYYNKNPKSFLGAIFGAIYEPEYRSDTTKEAAYEMYKAAYWDRFPFDDERIAYTPIYHGKIEKYFNKVVLPIADSVQKEALWLLDTTEGKKELFNYTLWYANSYIWSAKIMGLEEAILPIADKYYHDPENVFWLDSAKYEKMMQKIVLMQPSMLYNTGQNLKLEDRQGQTVMLHDIPGDYLALVFWEPDCGHCRKVVPRIDSMYKSDPEAYKDIQLVAIKTGGDSTVYDDFIKEKNLEEGWLHLNDDQRQSNLRYYYDVESTPLLVVLNPQRQIIAKKINFEDITKLIEIDKKNRNEKTNN